MIDNILIPTTAQRILETGLGLRLNPFTCTETEMLEAVDRLVMDDQLTAKMAQIGQRIRAAKDKQMVADILEGLKGKSIAEA